MIDVDLNFVRGEIDDLLAVESGLTDWEVGFIESVSRRVENGRLPLTDKQAATLHRIWDRVCGSVTGSPEKMKEKQQ